MSARIGILKVEIEKSVNEDIFGWCRAANSECSGMGLATMQNGVIRVTKAFFPKQYCSAGYTELDWRSLGKLRYHLHNKNVDPILLRWWWHTHYNFGTFWSGTDVQNSIDLTNESGGWILSTVINQKGDVLSKLNMLDPVPIEVDEIETVVVADSTRRRHKKNYRSDIKKWVRSMSEMPSTQKPAGKVFVEEGVGANKTIGFDWWKRGTKLEKEEKKYVPYEYHYQPNMWTSPGKGDKKNYKKIEGRPKSFYYDGEWHEDKKPTKKCSCAHNPVNWEDCLCTAECYACIDILIEKERSEAKRGSEDTRTEKESCPCEVYKDYSSCICPYECEPCRSKALV